jgi:hypothetical protein
VGWFPSHVARMTRREEGWQESVIYELLDGKLNSTKMMIIKYKMMIIKYNQTFTPYY